MAQSFRIATKLDFALEMNYSRTHFTLLHSDTDFLFRLQQSGRKRGTRDSSSKSFIFAKRGI